MSTNFSEEFIKDITLPTPSKLVNDENSSLPLLELQHNINYVANLLGVGGTSIESSDDSSFSGNVLDYDSDGKKIFINGGNMDTVEKKNSWIAVENGNVMNSTDVQSTGGAARLLVYRGTNSSTTSPVRCSYLQREFYIPRSLRGKELLFAVKGTGTYLASAKANLPFDYEIPYCDVGVVEGEEKVAKPLLSTSSTNTIPLKLNTSTETYNFDIDEEWVDISNKVGIAYNSTTSTFVAVGHGNISSCTDGLTWIRRKTDNIPWTSVAYSSTLGIFLAVSYDGKIATSSSGTTWTVSNSEDLSLNAKKVLWNGTSFIAIGVNPSNSRHSIATSSDGITWTLRYTASSGSITIEDVSPLSTGNSNLVAVGKNIILHSSNNGTTWNVRTSSMSATGGVYRYSVASNGSRFIILNLNPSASVSSSVVEYMDSPYTSAIAGNPGSNNWDNRGSLSVTYNSSASRFYSCGFDGYLKKSDGSGGTGWTNIELDRSYKLTEIIRVNGGTNLNTMVAVGLEAGLIVSIKTTDNGNTWKDYAPNPTDCRTDPGATCLPEDSTASRNLTSGCYARYEDIGIEVIGASDSVQEMAVIGPWPNHKYYADSQWGPEFRTAFVKFRVGESTSNIKIRIRRTRSDGAIAISQIYLGEVVTPYNDFYYNNIDINEFYGFATGKSKKSSTNITGHHISHLLGRIQLSNILTTEQWRYLDQFNQTIKQFDLDSITPPRETTVSISGAPQNSTPRIRGLEFNPNIDSSCYFDMNVDGPNPGMCSIGLNYFVNTNDYTTISSITCDGTGSCDDCGIVRIEVEATVINQGDFGNPPDTTARRFDYAIPIPPEAKNGNMCFYELYGEFFKDLGIKKGSLVYFKITRRGAYSNDNFEGNFIMVAAKIGIASPSDDIPSPCPSSSYSGGIFVDDTLCS